MATTPDTNQMDVRQTREEIDAALKAGTASLHDSDPVQARAAEYRARVDEAKKPKTGDEAESRATQVSRMQLQGRWYM